MGRVQVPYSVIKQRVFIPGYNIIESSNGSFIIIGTLFHETNSAEIWLLNLAANGAKVWEELFGGLP